MMEPVSKPDVEHSESSPQAWWGAPKPKHTAISASLHFVIRGQERDKQLAGGREKELIQNLFNYKVSNSNKKQQQDISIVI